MKLNPLFNALRLIMRLSLYSVGLWIILPASAQLDLRVPPIRFRHDSDQLIGFIHSGEPSDDNFSSVAIFDYLQSDGC